MQQKITFFIPSLKGGGAEKILCNLANYFFEHNYAVEILTLIDGEAACELTYGIKREALLKHAERKFFVADNFKRLKRFTRYLSGCKASVFVVMLPMATAYLLFFRKLIHVPVVFCERNNPASYPFYKRLLLVKAPMTRET